MSHALVLIKKLCETTPSGLIHVGAHNGQEVAPFKASGSRPVVLIEAQEAPYAKLVAAVGGEPRFYPVQACCSSESGREVEFKVSSGSAMASSYKSPGKHLDYYPGIKFEESVTMKTKTLDDVLADLDLDPAQFEYLGMDVQGAEMDILLGAPRTLDHLKYLWLEVNFGGLYEGDASFYSIIDFMRERGFDLYYVEMKKQQWGDALFIRTGVVNPTSIGTDVSQRPKPAKPTNGGKAVAPKPVEGVRQRERLAAMENQIARLTEDRDRAVRQLARVRASRSWKVTEPLRRLKRAANALMSDGGTRN